MDYKRIDLNANDTPGAVECAAAMIVFACLMVGMWIIVCGIAYAALRALTH